MKNNFLFEIGCEELPPKNLKALSEALTNNIKQGLVKTGFAFGDVCSYATPRRIAVAINDLCAQQPDQNIERKGPAVNAPTAAMEGFLRSNNISADQLVEENGRVVYRFIEKGKSITELMPEIVSKAVTDLPIPKPMRWSDKEIQFIRPVHWIVMLYGNDIIPATILGLATSNKTYGHRFHHPAAIELKNPAEYETKLEKAFVIADFEKRKNKIFQELDRLAKEKSGSLSHNIELADEVTSIVEWPIALAGSFNKEFLKVPKEALIASMQDHQKCFPIQQYDALLPHFITISNIESKDKKVVIHGNERVINARLSDAKFFYETDCKQTLADRLETLKTVVFQAKLGTLYEKSERIAKLAKFIAEKINANPELAERAGLLCKTDLVSNMVNEFPELQGIMGCYYALNDKEDEAVAIAIRDQYLTYSLKEKLNTPISWAIALADRIDTLVGIFGINQAPTGDKDPFGLRRAAITVLRVLIEKELPLNLIELIKEAHKNYQHSLINNDTDKQAHQFILERLSGLYQDTNITTDTLSAVLTVANHTPYDIHIRINALQKFRALPEAAALAEANKRASNLLNKSGLAELFANNALEKIDVNLFNHESERQLYNSLKIINISNKDYLESLTQLATLQKPVANFFDNVLVMDENEKLRNNRLALLAALRQLFLQIADISLLQN